MSIQGWRMAAHASRGPLHVDMAMDVLRERFKSIEDSLVLLGFACGFEEARKNGIRVKGGLANDTFAFLHNVMAPRFQYMK